MYDFEEEDNTLNLSRQEINDLVQFISNQDDQPNIPQNIGFLYQSYLDNPINEKWDFKDYLKNQKV